MADKFDQSSRGMLEILAAWLGLCVSLVTLGAVIWQFGALGQTVKQHSSRINVLEQNGSSGLRSHESMDDIRASDLEKRVARLEDAMAGITAIREDIREIKTRLQILTANGTVLPQVQKVTP